MQNGPRGGHVDYRGIKAKSSFTEMMRYVFSGVANSKGLLVFNVLVLTLIAVLQFFVPQFTQNIINNVVSKQSNGYLIQQILLMLGATILMGILGFISAHSMTKLSQNAITDLRLRLYNFLLEEDYAFFQNAKTGDLMTRLTSDISNLQQLIGSDTFGIIGSVFTFVAVLGFLFYQNWQLALMVTLTFPILFITIRFFRTKMSQAFAKVRANQSLTSNQLQSTLTQIELIKDFTMEDEETKEFKNVVTKGNQYQLEAVNWSSILQPLVQFINQFGVAIVLLFGGMAVINSKMSIGELVAYTQYLAILQSPIRSFSQIINRVQNAQISFDRIKELLDQQPKIIDSSDAIDFPEFKNEIKLNKITFSYEPENKKIKPATKDVSMTIPVGSTTALVGRSGSGKSTITKLLTRLYDVEKGSITYDGIDIKDIKSKSLREHISVVSQNVTIVDGTVADNISYGSGKVTDKQIMDAAKLADIDTFIKSLPKGLKTEVGERGVKLSGGQKQRISIARAFLKDAPIVILDEATAALDNESEKEIQNAIDNLMIKRTAIVIAHRLSTIHKADQIVVMDNGKVVETGTHQDLLKKKTGNYKKLYDAQFK